MKIDLKGIASNISPLNTNGTAQDIIGLRNKFGEWNSIPGVKDIISLSPQGESYYIHYMNDAKYYWYYNPEGHYIQRYKPENNTYPVMKYLDDDEAFYSFIHFGNFFMINTSLGAYKFIYDEGEYVELPELPKLKWHVETSDREKLTDTKTNVNTVESLDWTTNILSMIQNAINEAEENGKTQGHTLFILSFETITGEYIMPTPIQYNYLGALIEDGETNTTTFSEMITYGKLNDTLKEIYVSVGGEYVKPIIVINLSADDYNKIIKYDGLIRGISVFMTKPEFDYNLDTKHTQYIEDDGTGDTKKWLVFPDNNITSDELLSNSISFYKLGYFELSDLYVGKNYKKFDVNNIETKEVLSSVISHQISGKTAIDYNDRIHLGNITNILTDIPDLSIDDQAKSYAYSDPQYPSVGYNNPIYPFFCVVKLKVDNKIKVVVTEFTEVAVRNGGTIYVINPILSYPDSRAYEMSLIQLKNGVYEKIGKTVSLKSHDSLNIAYFVRDIYKIHINYQFPGAEDAVNSGISFNILRYLEIKSATNYGTLDIPDDNRYYDDKNRIQLSANSDPLIWPAINSYRIGMLNQEVKSLSVNKIQLSEGQYGEHPLFVFSESGIWALLKGDDSIYSGIVPVSRDIILNDKSIHTKIGVLFATEKGIVVQSGRDSLVLSQAIEGEFKNFIYSLDQFTKLTDKTAGTGNLKDYLNEDGNIDWSGASLGFDYVNDEVYVSFPGKYTFIFNTLSKQWYKRKESWKELLLNEGHLVGVTESGTFQDINGNVSMVSSQDFIYISNPMSFDNVELKKYFNVRLSYMGESRSITPTANLAVYIFGSNNLQEWKFIAGKRFKQTKLLKLNKVRASVKYHVIVISGNQYAPVFKDIDIDFI